MNNEHIKLNIGDATLVGKMLAENPYMNPSYNPHVFFKVEIAPTTFEEVTIQTKELLNKIDNIKVVDFVQELVNEHIKMLKEKEFKENIKSEFKKSLSKVEYVADESTFKSTLRFTYNKPLEDFLIKLESGHIVHPRGLGATTRLRCLADAIFSQKGTVAYCCKNIGYLNSYKSWTNLTKQDLIRGRTLNYDYLLLDGFSEKEYKEALVNHPNCVVISVTPFSDYSTQK